MIIDKEEFSVDEAGLAHSEKLKNYIIEKIDAAGGQITFADFMGLSLYAPGLGYYVAGTQKFGKQGDFITAPELSAHFARCLANQCRQILTEIPQGNILEFGAGSGILAADLLSALDEKNSLPKNYFILDVSGELKQRQQKLLQERIPHLLDRVIWLEQLPQPGFQGVVIANEVIDAMPTHKVNISAEQQQEYYVAYKDDKFAFQLAEPSSVTLSNKLQELSGLLAEQGVKINYETEINLQSIAWINSLAEIVEQGAVLIIDYGFPQHEYYHPQRSQGTIMCHYQHRAHPDPLILVGLQDITAHVDFTALAEAACGVGFTISGYTSQGAFLVNCGLLGLLEQTDDANKQWQTNQVVQQLTSPAEMGELFKVLALTKNLDEEFLGFSFQDRRGRL